ncbi:MAG: hypothetical protein HC801_06605, partial [Nitrospira sp.]|nr:hypothetical protein [Nitrospira sp.]
MKRTEDELSVAKTQLEARIKTLKEDLTRAHVELREGQVARQGLERRLQEAHKMEAVGRVAARIAKEFGALFAVIGKQTGMMLSQFQPNDPLRSSADEIFKVGEKAATLTAQLIALNLEGRWDRQMVPVHEVLADVQGTMVSLLPADVTLTVKTEKPMAYAEVDREGLETILFQLVVNARDAMPNGGRLSIEVKTLNGAVQLSRSLSMGLEHPQILIEMTDTGTGMNLDTQAH